MNIKKKLTTMSLSALALGAIAFTNVEEAGAATWEARTVENVRQDVQNLGQGEVEYTVQWGDTLGTIAKAVDIPVETLVEINGINNADLIVVENTIRFSADEETVTVEDKVRHEEKTYDVSEGQAEEVTTEPIEEGEVVEEVPAEFEAQAAAGQAELDAQALEQAEEDAEAQATPAEEQAPIVEEVVEEAQPVVEEPVEALVQEEPVQEEPAVENVAATEAPAQEETVPASQQYSVQTMSVTTETRTASVEQSAAQSSSEPDPVVEKEQQTTQPAANGSVIGIANNYLGAPYLWAGTTPSGFDCSGFTQFVFAQAGISIGRNTNAQYAQATPVSNPQAGDLVFFSNDGYSITHVGIYSGGGQFIGAQSSTGVAYTNVHSGYWGPLFVGYGRI